MALTEAFSSAAPVSSGPSDFPARDSTSDLTEGVLLLVSILTLGAAEYESANDVRRCRGGTGILGYGLFASL
jgi:hypothetical protein